MALQCGIVGLPNVGKSSLFNALTEANIASENYPFCTIEPNVGVVAVEDKRLDKLAKQANSAKVIPASVRLIDIAGLVKGASQGEGLGNKFLANIREVDGIVHVLRCFEDEQVTHVAGKVDPVTDAQTVELELCLADLALLQKAAEKQQKLFRSGDKQAQKTLQVCEKVINGLDQDIEIRNQNLTDDELLELKPYGLLTVKPVLYCANLDESSNIDDNEHFKAVVELAQSKQSGVLAICAKIESELIALDKDERAEMLSALGWEQSGIQRLVKAAYDLLDLKTFFTVGPKEARAWEYKNGYNAQQAAGIIHSDMERGFIRAETITVEDYLTFGGESGCREAGKLRTEGKEYIVQDGDILHFLFNT